MEHFQFTTLQLCGKINDLLISMGQTPETFKGRILFMSIFRDISCDRKARKMNVRRMPESSNYVQRDLIWYWTIVISWLSRFCEGSGIFRKRINSPQGVWDNIAEQMVLEFAESGHLIFRFHCFDEISKVNDMENCRFTIVPIRNN